MLCTHCGKSLPVNAEYCPYCAEPVCSMSTTKQEQNTENVTATLILRSVVIMMFNIIPSAVFAFIITFFVNNSIEFFGKYFAAAFLVLLVIPIIYLLCTVNSKKEMKILQQYVYDSTSICPMCGSHSVKIYRKGYNYNEAFWGSIFKIRGSRYTAGMNSNNAMCHCQHCGHDWNSGYDYRKIK